MDFLNKNEGIKGVIGSNPIGGEILGYATKLSDMGYRRKKKSGK
jgi:hypothetical protein